MLVLFVTGIVTLYPFIVISLSTNFYPRCAVINIDSRLYFERPTKNLCHKLRSTKGRTRFYNLTSSSLL